ncbi:CapA family protein [Saccharomonospora sp. NB11]|uniref:CapA family protein n=1 Tax=Saccharomonospora sp. NB11 TaxID=1642298 RepID=UPI0018D19164|nr:CapA family protein [Saccharomonospora sp. NB11]
MAALKLFLAGDVMPGRGIDQVLAHPGDPRLRESVVRDARYYVHAAEQRNGPLPRPVPFSWPWGSALGVIDREAPSARIVNLETSVTRARAFAPGKAVHYRMSPDNVPVLLVARPDVCVLANNHVLDFGRRGLTETLAVLARAGLRTAGAGHDAAEAARPAVVPTREGRVVVFAAAATTSGVPVEWAAGPREPGVRVLEGAVVELEEQVADAKRDGALVVVSLHWGSNWGYGVGARQVAVAHRLVDAGADVVHGHSSHHPRPIEVYRDRLVLYGCGDLLDDYEGISGFERYRGDLRLLYFPTLDADTGALVELRMVPMQARRLRLQPAGSRDREWLRSVLARSSAPFGTGVEDVDGVLRLTWPGNVL